MDSIRRLGLNMVQDIIALAPVRYQRPSEHAARSWLLPAYAAARPTKQLLAGLKSYMLLPIIMCRSASAMR